MFSDSVIMCPTANGGLDANSYTSSGHVIGMLDRDQRTAKIRCDSCQQRYSATFLQTGAAFLNYPHHHHQHYHRLHHHTYRVHTRNRKFPLEQIDHRHLLKHKSSQSTRSRKNNYLWNTLRRLKQTLITGIYLLSLVSVPCSLSAPTKIQMATDERMASKEKWINPCGIDLTNGAVHDPNTQIPKVSDSDLLDQIVLQANLALRSAKQFQEEFAQENFKMDFKNLYGTWHDDRYDWLPDQAQIPKNLDENVTQEHLQSLKLDDALVDTYHYLQMIAVGLEQVVWDQEDNNGRFLQGFNQSEYNLRLVLCEIQMAIYERGIQDQMRQDIDRNIYSKEDRLNASNSNTARNLRDWIIYRDYMNALEYVIQVFAYFKSNL